ncbi:MAG: glycosyltransferase [Patescibacteria group bacterium]|nr:glycosyltransferase [Patescibacteria group bacterium]
MLSVIIPTYNEEKYLPYLLRSLVAQTSENFEVIIADNRSKDKTREIATSFGARVVDGGIPSEGRNAGAAAAKGDILLFLDSDVILPDPRFIEDTIAEFRKKKLGVATCMVQPMSDKKVDHVMHEAFNYFMWVTAATKPHAPGFCIFARRIVHNAIDGFDPEIVLAEDHDYVERASKKGKFGILKSHKIPVSVRRLDKDGRFKTAVKYLAAEAYMRTKGKIKTDLFKYRFGYDESGKPKVRWLSLRRKKRK